MKKFYPRIVVLDGLLAFAIAGCVHLPESFDVLIVDGEVIDGTGTARVSADVGIRDGKVAFVGRVSDDMKAAEVVDADGLVVAPGFIDVHSHTLDVVLKDEWKGPQLNAQYLTQGVTTIVTGADGSWAPSRVRSIKERLNAEGSGVNFACYIGHNGIRREVMGDDQKRAPSDEELGQMRALVREGMEEGCVGLSTGLMYEPGMFSTTDEVIALAKEVKPFGGTYDSHVRDPVRNLLDSDREVIEIGRAAGISPKLAHEKAVGLENRGRTVEIIHLVEAARAEGIDVVSDQYPYNSAATHTLYELILFPGIYDFYEQYELGDLSEGELREIIRRTISDKSRRDELKNYAENGLNGGFSWLKMTGYGSTRILVSSEDASLEDKNIQLLAEEREIDPFDLVLELLLRFEEPLLVTFGTIEESDVQNLLVQPWNMIASDGFYVGPEQEDTSGHPRSTGTFTRVLGHYSRELGLLSLEEAVRKMTSLPADHMGFDKRGRIEVGSVADVVVFNAHTVIDNSTWSNPNALSDGIEYVLVNGKFAIRNGETTGQAAGTFVPRSVP